MTLEALALSTCEQYNVTMELLRSPSRARHLSSIRAALCTQAIKQRVATLSEIARLLNRDASGLTRLLARRASGPTFR
jgi:chromosomal replication initiation ATPase DnaA